jgi:hypothetical protein
MTEREHHPGCEDQGLFAKFHVARTDGQSEPGGRHEGCCYFPLDLTCDPLAREVAMSYARQAAVQEGRTRLALELATRVRELNARDGAAGDGRRR